MISFYIIITLIFLIFSIIFFKYFFEKQIVSSARINKISVVVAAKNESGNIKNLIKALSSQTYPVNSFEVIIVNDNSSDDTYEKITESIQDLSNFKVLTAKNKIFEAKRGALQTGIESSKYPYILITDADCEPSGQWIEKSNEMFNRGFDFIFGLAPFFTENTFVNKLARFENLWTHILTFSFAKIGLPYSATARNFGFKKLSFEEIGGYKNTTQSLSGDDDLLLREAVKHKLKIGCITDRTASVLSKSPSSYSAYLKQKARHTSTSHHYLPKHKFLLGLWHLSNLILLFGVFYIWNAPALLYFFLIKLLTNFTLVSVKQRITGYNFSFIEILYLQVLYDIQIIINFANSFFLKRNWKSDS